MPRIKSVEEQELHDFVEKCLDLAPHLADLIRRLEHDFGTVRKTPVQRAAAVLNTARLMSELASKLLITAQLAEQKAELMEKFKARKS